MRLNDYTVPNSELRVNGTLRFENESLAGQTSSTSSTNNGIKPKELQVSLMIRFSDEDQLTELALVAESVDDNGSLSIYDIVEPAANAMNIRQVQFTNNLNWREIEGVNAWRLTFSLLEYLSVPEKAELRLSTADPQTQSADGTTVVDSSQEETTESLTGFESFLSKVDKALA